MDKHERWRLSTFSPGLVGMSPNRSRTITRQVATGLLPYSLNHKGIQAVWLNTQLLSLFIVVIVNYKVLPTSTAARLVIVSWPSVHPYYGITSPLIHRLIWMRPGCLMTVSCQLEPPGIRDSLRESIGFTWSLVSSKAFNPLYRVCSRFQPSRFRCQFSIWQSRDG